MIYSKNLTPLFYALCVLFVSCSYPLAEQPAVTSSQPPQSQLETSVAENLPKPAPKPAVVAPKITAIAAIVYDPRTGRIIYEKNARERRAVASTQKLLTALLAVEHGLNQTVTVPQAATTLEPSKLYLSAGTSYELSSLVEAMMIKSGNDVAYTIGHGIAGSNEAFIQQMNARAKSLGMYNSNFLNPHGLTATGQYSTAYDIALLASAAYRSDFIKSCMRKKESIFTYSDGRTKTLYNTNKLLGRVSFCDGMKTGTTRASGKCLVSSGTFNGKPRIVVVLGADSKENLWKDSEILLRWGMGN